MALPLRKVKTSAIRPSQHDSELDEGEEVQSELLVACSESAALLEPADAAWPPHGVHHLAELRRFVRLARGERGPEDKAVAVSNQVEL